jgi:hypothetical protein
MTAGNSEKNTEKGSDNSVPKNKLHSLKMRQWYGSGRIDKITKGHYKIMAFCNL